MTEPQTTAESRKATIPFRAKLTVLGALLSVVPLSAVGIALLEIGSNTVQAMSQEFQISVADDLARTIDSELRDAQNGLDAVGRVLTDTNLNEDAAIELAKNLVASNEVLDHVGLYTLSGELIDVIREEGIESIRVPESISERARNEASIENVATGEVLAQSDGPRVPIILPLKSGGQISGFAASLVSLMNVQSRVERLSETRFEDVPNSVFVVDEKMRIIAHPDRPIAEALTSAKSVGVLQGINPATMNDRLQKSGEFVGADSIPMVGTVVGTRTRPWGVIAQVPQRIAYASLITMRKIILYTTAIAIALALLVAFMVARQITRPIDELSNFAKDLAARRFDKRLTVNTRDELAILGDVMSSAAADLQASEARIREEEAIRGDLGRYLPANLVEKVVKREQDMDLGGRRREVTVLFADVVGFTPMVDTMAADDIVPMLNELFTILTEIVFRHGGTVDKFIGDCVMAIWGAPTAQDDQASLAISAAEDMIRWLEAGNEGWEKKYGIKIEIAIGINAGDVVVGNIGSETRMQYTAIGDAVNVAAHLESIARPQQILLTQAVKDAAGPGFEYRSLGSRQLAGRHEPVTLFEVRV